MNDREFLKLFSGLLGALVALTIILIVLANVVAHRTIQQSSNAHATAEPNKPVDRLAAGHPPSSDGFSLISAAHAATESKGESVFKGTCFACHGSGVAGAPKVGDKKAWAPRIAKGKSTLYMHALKGFQGSNGFMPAKGGNASLSDADVKAAVDYMVSRAK